MLSFLKSYLKWIALAFICSVLVFYFAKVWDAFQRGSGFLNSLLDFGIGYVVSAFTSLMVFYRWVDGLDRLDGLQEEIDGSLAEIKRLNGEERKLKGEIPALERKKEDYQNDIGKLSHEIECLSNKKEELLSYIKSLEERKGNLASYLEGEFQKGYEAGRKQGYRSVITELRSIRLQKSALLKLFDSNKELKDTFKSVTGKTIRQYLDRVKERIKNSGGKIEGL
jgi:chromosome segregation ATPase